MPSTVHEVLIEMFRHRPCLAAELLTDGLGLNLPAYQQARLEPGELRVCTEAYDRTVAGIITAIVAPIKQRLESKRRSNKLSSRRTALTTATPSV